MQREVLPSKTKASFKNNWCKKILATLLKNILHHIEKFLKRVHGKTTYEWHTDDIRVHTSHVRMTYEYTRVTYGWHTS